MTPQEIIEGNKLIAEFIGWKCSTRLSYEDKIKVLYKPNGTIFKYQGITYLKNLNPWNAPLKFHNSWDWLIPVIDKILSSEEYFEYKKTLNIYTSGVFVNTKFIEVSFNSVVEFIKWYNENKKL